MTNLDIDCINTLQSAIEESTNIYLASHISPDGDSLGSLLGLGMALSNKNVYLVKVDDIPETYKFLPNISKITTEEPSSNIDLFISLDCADLNRLGDVGLNFFKQADKTVNIDHHSTNTNYSDINLVSPNTSSTCELVYEILNYCTYPLNKDIATCLYTGINTDTGSFKYSNTSWRTHEIVAKLIKQGIDTEKISIELYQKISIVKTKVFVEALRDLKFFCDGKIGLTKINQNLLEKNNASWEDTEDIIGFIRDINGVEVACLLKEYGNEEIKVSLRSKEYVDVSKICKTFSGGGHIRASGCTIYEKLDRAEVEILSEIKKFIR